MARFFNRSVYTYNKFNFTPRIYDPQKEKLEEMRKSVEASNSLNPDGSINEEMLRRRMNKSRAKYDKNDKADSQRTRRLLALMALLIGLVFVFFKVVEAVDTGVTYIYDNSKPQSEIKK